MSPLYSSPVPTNLVIGEFEQIVMLALLHLGEQGYVVELRARLGELAGREISRGALYRTLDRLEEKGWVSWDVETEPPERGGHARRRFRVSERGIAVLRASRATLQQLWRGLEEVLG
jgi:DNA-binding PadR family transcriptional regulator